MKRTRFHWWRRFQERHSLPEILAAAFVLSLLAISVTAGAQVSQKLDQSRLAAPNKVAPDQTKKTTVATKAGQVGALSASPHQRPHANSTVQKHSAHQAVPPKRVDPSVKKATDPDDEEDDGDAEAGVSADLAVHVGASGAAVVTLLEYGSGRDGRE
jgi:hypothetical protein